MRRFFQVLALIALFFACVATPGAVSAQVNDGNLWVEQQQREARAGRDAAEAERAAEEAAHQAQLERERAQMTSPEECQAIEDAADPNQSIYPKCVEAAFGDPKEHIEEYQHCIEVQLQECYAKCLECDLQKQREQVNPVRTAPPGYDGPIPKCAFTYEGCRNVNSLLEMAVRIAKFLFGIIGSLALLFFIYGGITIIMSFGNSEKLKKGQQILVAAVVGMAISFSAFLLVSFLLDTIGVSSDFDFRQAQSTQAEYTDKTYL